MDTNSWTERRTMLPRSLQLVLFGALGGLYGAGVMSVIRLAIHRAGLIDKMVPQVVEEWIAHRANADPPGGLPGHQAADQMLHLAYGTLWGAASAPLLVAFGRSQRLWPGAALGLSLWGIGTGLFPLLKIARPAWRSGVPENLTNVAGHLAYGLAVQLVTEELERQGDRRRTSDAERGAARVG